jgi:hypothetical protein
MERIAAMCAADGSSAYAERRARFERYYDAGRRRLVYVGEAASVDFWDRRWLENATARYEVEPPRRSLVVSETTRHLAPGSLVLEGGCGLAANSWHLHRLGYRTLALDYARGTLHFVAARVPEVRPLLVYPRFGRSRATYGVCRCPRARSTATGRSV